MIAQLVLNGIKNDIESMTSGLSSKLSNELVTRIADRKLDADADLMQEVKRGIGEVQSRAQRMELHAHNITAELAPAITTLRATIEKVFTRKREVQRIYLITIAALAGLLAIMVLFFVIGWPHQWGLLARIFACRFAWFRNEGGFGLVPLVH
jgi:CII-binding regulator of phage lambda lysogenization HflD